MKKFFGATVLAAVLTISTSACEVPEDGSTGG